MTTIINMLHKVCVNGNEFVAKASREEYNKSGKRFILTDNEGAGFQSPIMALEAFKYFQAKGHRDIKMINPEIGEKDKDENNF